MDNSTAKISSRTLKALFQTDRFKDYSSEFEKLFQCGAAMNPIEGVNVLQRMTNDYCGISLGRRTVTFDLAESLFTETPALLEQVNAQNDADPHLNQYWKELFPQDTGEFMGDTEDDDDGYDVACLSLSEYLQIFIKILKEADTDLTEKQSVAYAGELFFRGFEEYESDAGINAAVRNAIKNLDYDEED